MSAVPLHRLHHLDLGLGTARDLLEREHHDHHRGDGLPVPLDGLERLLPGGLRRGELYELVGDRSSGRLSIVLALLAAAGASGETAALVDLGDHFDPAEAARAGVVLERLLWLRPVSVKQALAAAETAIQGGFPLVVCDLGTPPIPGGRGAQSHWLRLHGAARAQRAALLVSTPYRACGAAATAVLEARRGRARWGGLLEALDLRVGLKKMRGNTPESSAGLRLRRGDLALSPPPALRAHPAASAPISPMADARRRS